MRCGVVFDMDGVLVNSEGAHDESWQELGKRHGIPMGDDAFEDSYGRTTRDILTRLLPGKVDEAILEKYDREKEQIYRDIVKDNLPLMEGVQELLTDLKSQGHVLAVGTSGPRENLELVLEVGGLRSFFSAAINANDVERGKPDPAIFLLAAERAGMETGKIVVIEDAPAGIRAAKAASMIPIGVATTHDEQTLKKEGAHRVFPSTSALNPHLIQLIWEEHQRASL